MTDESVSGKPQLAQLAVGTDINPGPDGKPWIRTQIIIGVGAMVFSVPLESAEDFISGYERTFRQSMAIAKRQESGLILASGDMMPKSNGAGNRHSRRHPNG